MGVHGIDRIHHVRWLGFIDRNAALYLGDAVKPVRLDVNRYSNPHSGNGIFDWKSLEKNEYVLGCLLLKPQGVFAVTENNKIKTVNY